MLDQFGNHIPGTKKAADYKKYADNGTEAFFVKRNPLTGVETRMVYDKRTGDVKIQKTVRIDGTAEVAGKVRNHAYGKRAYAGHGKHQIAWMAPNIIVQEMKEKAGLDAEGNYDYREFNRMLDGTSKWGDYSQWKMLKGKMPQMKVEA
jgi:hypothetical protein